MPDIDMGKLVLQIETDSKSAVSGIDALAASLGKLKSATSGGLGLNAVAKNIAALKSSLSGIGKIGNDTQGLTKAVLTLKQLGSVKVSASIPNQIRKIGDVLSNFDMGDGANKITDLVSALKPLETLGKSSLSSTVSALNKLPEAIQKIDMKKLHGQVDALTRTFRPLAEEMQKIANGFKAFPNRIQKLIKENEKITKSNKKVTTSYTEMYSKLRMAYAAIKTGAGFIGKAIKESNDYTENLNLFSVAMGEYADAARDYAEDVSEKMGIDPSEWMRAQGTIMTLATGFGVAGDRANKMSKNLTQLGYDLSSFFNLSVEESMQKIESGLAGELEPLRRIGFDLSIARLQQEAYTLGINKKVSAMTQAEKAELRYHAILTQVETAHGDLARTLNSPTNQLKILKAQVTQATRAIGNMFIPMLEAILPYAIAAVKVIRLLAQAIANLFGYKPFEADLSDLEGLSSGAEDYSDALGDAAKNAKKLKQYTMGFDELNVINPNDSSNSSDSSNLGTGFDFDLPSYDFLGKYAGSRADEIISNLKLTIKDVFTEWQDLTGEQIAKKIVTGLMALSGAMIGFSMGGIGGALLGVAIGTGLGLLIGAIDINNDGKLSTEEIMKIVEDSLLVAGAAIGLKLGGWKGGLLGITIGLGLKLAITSIKSIVEEGANPQNITKLILGALLSVGGIIGAIKLFNATNKAPLPEVETAGKTIGDTATGMSKVTGKLKSLATNLAWGVLILAEVAVAAGIIIGAIWGIGLLLGQVGEAWQPVIDNAGTVAIAIGIGTVLLVGIGAATAGLGTLGGAMVGQLAIGVAMLALLGVSAGLFLAEIWGIGVLLEQIGIAWQPVLDNGGTIATGIAIGTGLLIGIGVVAALLGVAAVASVGLLPLAIGVGTALLVELAWAFKEFCDSLIDVANKLSDDLHPALDELVDILPDLNDNMEDFTGFMTDFAELAVEYTKSSAISGFASTVDAIVKFFTKDPIKSLADDAKKQYEQGAKLNENLKLANPELQTAITGLETYKTRIDSIKGVVDTINTSDIAATGFTNLVTIGGKIADFGGKMKSYYEKIKDIKVATMDNMVSCINDVIDFAVRIKNEVDTKKIDNFTDAIKKLTTAVRELPTSKTLTITAIYQTSGTAPKGYATGGFPQTGEMFIAREAGPEMVGSIGRKTAVANNDQIVAGIASGVAEANSESNALLREQNSLLRAMLEKESGVYLDGKSITKSVEKHQRERGRVLVTGGAY